MYVPSLDETPTVMTSNFDGNLGDIIQKSDTGRCAYAYSCFRNMQVHTLSNAAQLNQVAKIKSGVTDVSKSHQLHTIESSKANAIYTANFLHLNGLLDVSETDADGNTALHYAARHNSLEVAKLLLANIANVNSTNNFGETPLTYAARGNSIGVATLLVEKRADIDAGRGDGKTPLHEAAENDSIQVVRLLLENHADMEAKDEDDGYNAPQ